VHKQLYQNNKPRNMVDRTTKKHEPTCLPQLQVTNGYAITGDLPKMNNVLATCKNNKQ
jgi:hypothetical protein